jgi:hypothetical protein
MLLQRKHAAIPLTAVLNASHVATRYLKLHAPNKPTIRLVNLSMWFNSLFDHSISLKLFPLSFFMLGICLPYVEFVIPLHFQSLEQIDHNIYSKKPIEKSYAKYYSQTEELNHMLKFTKRYNLNKHFYTSILNLWYGWVEC